MFPKLGLTTWNRFLKMLRNGKSITHSFSNAWNILIIYWWFVKKYKISVYNIFRSYLNVVFVGINSFVKLSFTLNNQIWAFFLLFTLAKDSFMGTSLNVILEDTFEAEACAQCTVCLPVANGGSHAYAPSAPFSHYIPREFKKKIFYYNFESHERFRTDA